MQSFRKRRWLNELGAGVAVLVSLISLWVGVRTEQANSKMVDANQRMVAAASWPFLQLDSGNGDENGQPTISLQLQNAGVGPAKIRSFELFWKGKAYPNAKALLEACCVSRQKSSWAVSTTPPKDFVLRAGDSCDESRSPHEHAGRVASYARIPQVRAAPIHYLAFAARL